MTRFRVILDVSAPSNWTVQDAKAYYSQVHPTDRVSVVIPLSCCDHDDDKDGNCAHHSAPGVWRVGREGQCK